MHCLMPAEQKWGCVVAWRGMPIGFCYLLDAKIGAISWRYLAVPVDHLLAGTVFLTL